MDKKLLTRVEVIASFPTPPGCALFLGDGKKVAVIFVDRPAGEAIMALLAPATKNKPHNPPPAERLPNTHDFIIRAFDALDVSVKDAVITHREGDVFHSHINFSMSNSFLEKTAFTSINARPGDAIACCLYHNAPFFVLSTLWDALPDEEKLLTALTQSPKPDKSSSRRSPKKSSRTSDPKTGELSPTPLVTEEEILQSLKDLELLPSSAENLSPPSPSPTPSSLSPLPPATPEPSAPPKKSRAKRQTSSSPKDSPKDSPTKAPKTKSKSKSPASASPESPQNPPPDNPAEAIAPPAGKSRKRPDSTSSTPKKRNSPRKKSPPQDNPDNPTPPGQP